MNKRELVLLGFVWPAAIVAAVLLALGLGGLPAWVITALAVVFMVAGSAVVVAV